MLDIEFIGAGTFYELLEFAEFAKKTGYKGSYKWRLPKWEELKQLHPHDWEGQSGEIWTDNATSSSFTAKRMQLLTGEFLECNQKFHYDEKALLRLMCDEIFNEDNAEIIEHKDKKYIVLPFGEMNYGAVDTLNSLLARVEFRSFMHYRRPTIFELDELLPNGKELPGIKDGWYWSSSEGGKFNAFRVNFFTGEKYACKKSSDYSEVKAYSIAVIE